MVAKDFILEELPFVVPQQTAGEALNLMDEFRLEFLPLVKNQLYEGLLSEDYLLSFDENTLLENVLPDRNRVYYTENQHLFELLDMVPSCNQSLIAIVSEDKTYLGATKLSNILKEFVIQLGRTEQGAILEISLKNKDYSLSEISSIIEAENVKIVSTYLTGYMVSLEAPLKLTLKLNSKDISAVLASLRRYKYDVEGYYSSNPLNSIDKDRYGLLMKYLDI